MGATQALACQLLMNLQWRDIDVAGLLNRIQGISEELQRLRDDDRDLKAV